MKCIKCGQEMVNISGGNYQYPSLVNDLVYREVTATIPFNPNDYQIATHCVVCGKEIVEQIKVCDDCKKAIAWAKENMKEKENE